jgi:hypothetical protein
MRVRQRSGRRYGQTAFVDVLAGKARHFMEEDQTSDEEEMFTARHIFAFAQPA